MRKALRKSVFLALAAAAFLTLTAAAAEIGTAVVEADSLRVRSEPSTESATVTYLVQDTKVTVHQALEGWYEVSWGDYSGYVAAEYVTYTPAQSASAAIDGSDVNFRAGPSTDHDILALLDHGAPLQLLSTEGEWCRVLYNGQEGYVSADYVSMTAQTAAAPVQESAPAPESAPVEEPPAVPAESAAPEEAPARGIITGDCVNVRDIPSTDGGILTKVYAGSIVELGTLADNWYAVTCNGVTGYICADYVREYSGDASSAIGEQVAALALEYLGVPYAYGGASAKGFDCSGFTMFVFQQFGFSLPHSATSQWQQSGAYVAREDLQPGDLVLFCDPSRSNGKACSHVGIYIGDNEFVHASSGSSGKYVRISSLQEDYYNRYFIGGKRIG